MKKVYHKPQIMFEDLTMNMAIATNCTAVKMETNGTQEALYLIEEDVTIFNVSAASSLCQMNDRYCYHNPSPTMVLEKFYSPIANS